MFNIGVFELGLFLIIALIVLGPEKLPEAARTLGKWYGWLKRTHARIQHDINQELDIIELKQMLNAQMQQVQSAQNALQNQIQNIENDLHHTTHYSINKEKSTVQQPFADASHSTPPICTTPMTHQFFLLGDYDKKKRLPKAPFMTHTKADALLYATNTVHAINADSDKHL